LTERRSLTIALAVIGLTVVLTAALVLLLWLTQRTGWQSASGAASNEFKLSDLLQGLPAAVIGAVIIWKRPGNRLGWIAAAAGISFVAVDFAYQYAVYALAANPGSLPGGEIAAWLNNWIWAPAPAALPFLFLLFPNGAPPSRRWRPVVWAATTAYGLLLVTPMFLPSPGNIPSAIDNPYHLSGPVERVLMIVYNLTFPVIVVLILIGGISLVWRFHRSTGDERLQIKWVAFSGGVTAFIYVADQATSLLGSVGHLTILGDLTSISLFCLEAVIGVAILKYHLYDIDLIIRRTLVYGSLMATLAAVYVGTILLLQQILSPVTGRSDLAIALSTLAVAALFQPLRHRIQPLVDRRFYRQKYDAERALAHFSLAARDEVDLEHLAGALIHVIGETIQPEHVSIWVSSTEKR